MPHITKVHPILQGLVHSVSTTVTALEIMFSAETKCAHALTVIRERLSVRKVHEKKTFTYLNLKYILLEQFKQFK